MRRYAICFVASVLQLWAASPSPPPPLPSGSGGAAGWGDSVYYYTPASPQNQIQGDFDTVFARNQNLIQASGQFLTQGYAFMFAPGVYMQTLNLQMGYYMSMMGLGQTPQDTSVQSINSYNASNDPCIGALQNYWRSAENFSTKPAVSSGGSIAMVWAASHGSWLRNVLISGRLYLSQFNVDSSNAFTPVGPSNGAFVANSDVNNWSVTDPNTHLGSPIYSAQRQLLVRNINLSSFVGANLPTWQGVGNSVWAQTFLGCHSFSATPIAPTIEFQAPLFPVCSNCPSQNPSPSNVCGCTNGICPATSTCTGLPATVVGQTPIIAEKPWIAYDGMNFSLIVPKSFSNTSGFHTFSIPGEADQVPFQNNVYVATPNDTLEFINNYLAQPPSGAAYRAVILTPGTYVLSGSIQITQPNTILLGIGFPTLIASSVLPCINVHAVDGVRVGGLILQAGGSEKLPNLSLITWGGFDSAANAAVQSGFLYDCTARVGRFDKQNDAVNHAERAFVIAASNIVCDNVWAWRADPDAFGSISSSVPVPAHTLRIGTFITGSKVTMYGLTSENALEDLTQWHGENGSCYSYQGVFPPDGKAPGVNYGFSGYQLDIANVTHHEAFDTGIYSQINDPRRDVNHGIEVPTGISAPNSSGIHFVNAFTRILNGNSLIMSVLPNSGETNVAGNTPVGYVSPAAPGPAYLINCEYGGPDEPNAAHLSAAPR